MAKRKLDTFRLAGFVGVFRGRNDWGGDEIEEEEVLREIEAVDQNDARRQAEIAVAEFRLAHLEKHGSLENFRAHLVLPPTIPPWEFRYPPKRTFGGA